MFKFNKIIGKSASLRFPKKKTKNLEHHDQFMYLRVDLIQENYEITYTISQANMQQFPNYIDNTTEYTVTIQSGNEHF